LEHHGPIGVGDPAGPLGPLDLLVHVLPCLRKSANDLHMTPSDKCLFSRAATRPWDQGRSPGLLNCAARLQIGPAAFGQRARGLTASCLSSNPSSWPSSLPSLPYSWLL